jgi:hypothetical protein
MFKPCATKEEESHTPGGKGPAAGMELITILILKNCNQSQKIQILGVVS